MSIICRVRRTQPQSAVMIDRKRAKDLSFELFPPMVCDLTNRRALSFTGTKRVIGIPGVGIGFGATDGVGSTDKIVVNQFSPAVQRSYFVLAKLNGFGGGSLGRLFEDLTGMELFYVNSTHGLVYWRQFDGGMRTANSGSATSVSDRFGKVAAYSVSFDSSNPANQPELYIDGVRYPFSTADGVPTGNALTYSGLCIGNRNSDNARACDGTIYVLRSFDRMLSAQEHAGLAMNPWKILGPRRYSIGLLVSAQYARPTSDVTTGAWVSSLGGPLYAAIDEVTADDADYISTTYGSVCEVALGSLTDPAVSSGHKVRYRIAADAGAIVVRLRQGTTTIASWTHSPAPTSLTTYEQTLSGAEADSITDYSALKLQFEAY